ncbi:MAG: glycosyltransferase N-terminal domain-containing protein [Vicingaceae bacterium]
MRFAYQIFVFLFQFGLRLASLSNPKAKRWVHGRKNWRKQLKDQLRDKRNCIWVHCASLGEFEQARPLIEKIKKEHPSYTIVLSFFSPSGYEQRKNYEYADVVTYLPMDFKKNARDFIETINPQFVVFIKYEYWFNYLKELERKQIPTFLLSGIFWKELFFFKTYGKWFARQLNAFEHFFVQNKTSAKLLKSIGYNNNTVCGDSRFDRVIELPKENFQPQALEEFAPSKNAIIFGSSWDKENEFAVKLALALPNQKIIIAQHEIDTTKINKFKKRFSNAVLWSEIEAESALKSINETQVLIIDSIGMLSKIYRYGRIAVIGGGFGAGIHNTLEAAVYGCPLLFGPNYQRFQEAIDLIELRAAFSITDYNEFEAKVQHLINKPDFYQKASAAAEKYVNQNSGATESIITYLRNKKILT